MNYYIAQTLWSDGRVYCETSFETEAEAREWVAETVDALDFEADYGRVITLDGELVSTYPESV